MLTWMSRKNIQRDIDVVKTSVWDVVDATSLRRCEDVSFNMQRTDQIETFSRRIKKNAMCLKDHYSTLGLILLWRVTRDVLQTRPS